MPTAAELARQVKEAEDLVRRLERGETAKPKDSQPVNLRTSKGGRYGDGPGLIPVSSHGGYAGKSLIEKIRDDLRETIGEREGMNNLDVGESGCCASSEAQYLDGLIDGICHALGILRGNDGETERRWAEAEYRETVRLEKEYDSKVQAQCEEKKKS